MTNADQLRDEARTTRVEIYSQWLADDVDGIIHNVKPSIGDPCPHATAVLADARERVALALSRIDQAIAKDRAAHREQEHA